MRVIHRLEVSEAAAERVLGRPNDGSEKWAFDAEIAVEGDVREDPVRYLDAAVDEPDVEVFA